MKNLDLFANYRTSQGRSVLFGNALISLMMVCLAVGFIQLGNRFNSAWQGGYLIWMTLLISLEATQTARSVRDLDFRERVIFRISEWIAFAVVIKLLIYMVHDPSQLLRDLPTWQEDFGNFFTPEYLLALSLAGMVWYSSGAFVNELDELYDRENDAEWDELGKLQNSLREIRKRIISRALVLGGVVIILAVLSRLDSSQILRSTGEPPPGYKAPVANVLVYFILALVLLSLTQFALLRTRWLWQRMPISAKLPTHWLKFGLIFFGILAVVVYFLPTEYSLGFFDTLRIGLDVFIQFITLLTLLITLPLGLCYRLFAITSNETESSAQPVVPQEPIEPSPQQPITIPWLEFLQSLFFWAVFLAIVYFAVTYYLRQNTTLWRSITNLPLVRWLRQGWGSFWQWIRGVNQQVGSLVSSGLKRIRSRRAASTAAARRRNYRTHPLTPREKIIAFYISLVQLGSERGLDRSPYQTPYQYEDQLVDVLPEVSQELKGLTDTFVEARYSQHPVDEPEVKQAGSFWDRVKEALRRWKRS